MLGSEAGHLLWRSVWAGGAQTQQRVWSSPAPCSVSRGQAKELGSQEAPKWPLLIESHFLKEEQYLRME